MIRAVIFDMDGVLMLSAPAHEAAFRAVLATLRIDEFEYSRFAGMRTKDCFRILLDEHGLKLDEKDLEKLAAAKSAASLRLIQRDNPIAPYCAETLEALRGRFVLALATSASCASMDYFLDANSLRGHFAAIVHSGMVKHAKPSPDIYTETCRRLGLAPEECLVVEDSVAGTVAALQARTEVCGISGTVTAAELLAAGAHRVVGTLPALSESLLG